MHTNESKGAHYTKEPLYTPYMVLTELTIQDIVYMLPFNIDNMVTIAHMRDKKIKKELVKE